MKVQFMSLGSGSSGNCYYLATETCSILIDAGVGIRTVKKIFKDYNIDMQCIHAIFITHDHADHIKAVGNLAKRYNIPVYATQAIHKGMERSYCMTEKLSADCIRLIEKEKTISLGDFTITCFEVPHDGTDNVGYCIETGDKTFAFLTDMGHITPTAASYIERADYLILEANYDDAMLQMGPYPPYLKARIAGPNGHMSNREAAQFIAEHFPSHLKVLLALPSKQRQQPSGTCIQDRRACLARTRHRSRTRYTTLRTKAHAAFRVVYFRIRLSDSGKSPTDRCADTYRFICCKIINLTPDEAICVR